MSVRNDDALPPDLRALLDDAGDAPGPTPEQGANLWARLESSLELPPPDSSGEGGEGGDAGPAVPEASVAASSAAASSGVAATVVKGSALAALAAKPLPLAIAMFALGTATGAGVVTVVRRDPPPIVAEAPAAPPPVIAEDAPSPTLAPAPRAELRVRRNAAAPLPGTDEDLAEERSLLEMARSAIARSDHARGLEAVEAHETRYPKGRLAEEREFLRIQALLGLGRNADAQERAARFEREHPKSFLVPVVRELLAPGSRE